jgi:putative ABC transport system permease protein
VLAVTWLRGLLRRPGRLAIVTLGVALAVAMLATLGSFLGASKATMTRRSVDSVAVDWQVEASTGADPTTVARSVAADARVTATQAVGFADTPSLTATVDGTTQTTGAGLVLGVPDAYRSTFPGQIRSLLGPMTGVLVTQQTAANLHVAPGDLVAIGRAGLDPVTVRVDGIVDLPQANSLFQKVGAPSGAQPQAPPDNVVLLPTPVWHQLFDPLATIRPDQVRTQIHARLDHHLPNDPGAAFNSVSGEARNLEVKLAGAGLVGDNLASALDAARGDALYSQALFLFLGLPGAVLAGLVTATFAASGAPRRRADQALLRTRGATVRTITRLAILESALVGFAAGVLGIGIALLAGRWAFHSWQLGATRVQAAAWSGGAVLIGLAIATLTIARPAWRDARALTVASSRRRVGRSTVPRWQRYGIDFALLAAAGLVYWFTSRNGYQLVLAPEGVPTISVSYWAFAGPALLWLGAGLLSWRIVETVLRRGRRPLTRILRPTSGPLAGTVAASLGRQRRLLAAAATLAALAVAFAASTATFNATYKHQAGVDAVLTNGADVTVTAPPGVNTLNADSTRVAAVPGVRHVEPLQHRYAYVGPDLQDLYGVNPATIVDAGKLQDAYVAGGTARGVFATLASSPDAVLVSAETAHDFQLRIGDTITLRLQDARTKSPIGVKFTYAGIVTEFPTAPRDSFLVANAGYVARASGDRSVNTLLVDTGGNDIAGVAKQIRGRVGTVATVTDLASTRRIVGSSLTAVDLSGLTRLELAFALALAAAAGGLALWLGLEERRRTNAIAAALGANRRQIGTFVHAETAVVTTAGIVLGAITGWALTRVLVKVLTGVFDPPPSTVTVPWTYLAVLTGTLVVAALAASTAAIRAARRSPIAILRTG